MCAHQPQANPNSSILKTQLSILEGSRLLDNVRTAGVLCSEKRMFSAILNQSLESISGQSLYQQLDRFPVPSLGSTDRHCVAT